MRFRGIGVKLGEFGGGKRDIGSCVDREVIERARKFLVRFEVAERIIGSGRFEFRALFEMEWMQIWRLTYCTWQVDDRYIRVDR